MSIDFWARSVVTLTILGEKWSTGNPWAPCYLRRYLLVLHREYHGIHFLTPEVQIFPLLWLKEECCPCTENTDYAAVFGKNKVKILRYYKNVGPLSCHLWLLYCPYSKDKWNEKVNVKISELQAWRFLGVPWWCSFFLLPLFVAPTFLLISI